MSTLTPGTKAIPTSNPKDELLREARDALDAIASERDNVRWDLAKRIDAALATPHETGERRFTGPGYVLDTIRTLATADSLIDKPTATERIKLIADLCATILSPSEKAGEPPLCVFRSGCQSRDACGRSGQCESDFAKNLRKAASESESDVRTVWEKARDAINEAIRQAPDTNRRVLAVKALHEIAEAMRGTPCTDTSAQR